MILGLDMGGTHTDAVLVKDGSIIASTKVETDRDDLLSSVVGAIDQVTRDVDRSAIERINLSTTLSTNAIVEKRIEPAALIISAGPGVNAENYKLGEHFHIIDGSIDHRGTEIKGLDQDQLSSALDQCRNEGVKVFALVTKFSTRNPDQEQLMAQAVKDDADFFTMGHRLSGQLSFPRRLATAFYNTSTWRVYNRFADAIEKGMEELGISAEIHFLKADGGTMPLERSREFPVESILSGPAASVMGIVGLCHITEDSVIIDIGGTTTDIAVFAEGAPLIERDGITIGGSATLVHALNTVSIGVGGDSAVSFKGGEILVGPERFGPAMAAGGTVPTLVDALNVAGSLAFRDTGKSLEGMKQLAQEAGIEPEECARRAVNAAVSAITGAVNHFVEAINEKPVYTIHEMLAGKKIQLEKVYVVGGPAEALHPLLQEAFSLDVVVPSNYEVANAIGAALARITFDIELFADTAKGTLIIPNLEVRETIDKQYNLEQAQQDAVHYLREHMKTLGAQLEEKDIEILEAVSFRMAGGFFNRGNDIRVKCQVKPASGRIVREGIHA